MLKVRWVVSLLLGMFVLSGCGDGGDGDGMGSGGATGGTVISIIQNAQFQCENAYDPDPLTVALGTEVTWRNDDNMEHTVTHSNGVICLPSDAKPNPDFDSGNIAPGGTFSYTFNDAGTFDYVCTINGHTMRGTVIVNAM